MEDYETVDEGQPSFVQADHRTAADGPGGLGEEPMTVDAESPAASVFPRMFGRFFVYRVLA